VNSLIKKGEKFESLMHGKQLEQWGMEPICAQAYLGGLCIAEAFRQGADIVIAGRVADAAPVIGAAASVPQLLHVEQRLIRLDGGTIGKMTSLTNSQRHWLLDI
jgi:hypothetical protein